jgi:general secretion pathway protein D
VVKFEKEGYQTKGEIVNLEKNKTDLAIFLEKDPSFSAGIQNKNASASISKSEIAVIDGEKYYTEQVKLFRMPAIEMKVILEGTYEGLLRATPVEKFNSVILFGRKEVVELAKKIIRNLDGDIKQVRVSSQILDVSDNLFEELGFDWVYSNNGGITEARGANGSFLKNSLVDGIGSNFSTGLGIIRHFNGG